jgi:hypothetical protein
MHYKLAQSLLEAFFARAHAARGGAALALTIVRASRFEGVPNASDATAPSGAGISRFG